MSNSEQQQMTYETPWDVKSIRATQAKYIGELLKDSSREEVMEKLIDLRTAIYGIYRTLQALEPDGYSHDKRSASIGITSDFFAENFREDDESLVALWEKGDDNEFIHEEMNWAKKQRLIHRESASINVHDDAPCDDIEILGTHESGFAYCFGGTITFGDARLLAKVFQTLAPVLSLVKESDAKAFGEITA